MTVTLADCKDSVKMRTKVIDKKLKFFFGQFGAEKKKKKE